MAIVVVGGHAKNIGKTAVVAAIIARMPERHWTAMKITQHGHERRSAGGEKCDGACTDYTRAIPLDHGALDGDALSCTDTGRFLAAGALRSLWVRPAAGKPGSLAGAMPDVHKEIASAENVIIESNSILQFLQPDILLFVMDDATPDFKESALRALDRADAILLRTTEGVLSHRWKAIPSKFLGHKRIFEFAPPEYLTDAAGEFVRERMIATTGAKETALG